MLPLLVLALLAQDADPAPESPLAVSEVRAAGYVAGVEFTDAEIELMLEDVTETLAGYERARAIPLPNSVPFAFGFTPLQPGIELRARRVPAAVLELPAAERPADLEELAFADIPTLAALVRAREVSCVELAELFLARLERLDATLECVVTLAPERALARARELDRELEAGRWRGPLHGIPWGAKDLIAVRGLPTTFGARPFEHQVIDDDATVVERLDAAGAVLIAKLSVGALAWGDVWFGGTTRNPWKPEQGSSGSSAGSAAATAAGGVVFALGTETLGSIVSPCERCGTSGLRPTFGRVPRSGAMMLAWTMDKIGPITRSARDAAIVLAAIAGADGEDPTAAGSDVPPCVWPGELAVEGWKVGYPRGAEESEAFAEVLAQLEALGVEVAAVDLPDFPVTEMMVVLGAEAATVFDELTRSGRDDLLTRQGRDAWPNVFRASRLIPAVEYLRAQRLRALLASAMDETMSGLDALVHPSFFGSILSITNLTGHPTLVTPAGFREDGTPYGTSFTGQLFDESRLAALVHAWQEANGAHRVHPALEFLDVPEPAGGGR